VTLPPARDKVPLLIITNVGCYIEGEFIILYIRRRCGNMITNIHFEVFASGMKAKLDPTYRRAFEDQRLPARAEILGKMARCSHQAFLPFTTMRKASDAFDRK
jgi:hypothetical protein